MNVSLEEFRKIEKEYMQGVNFIDNIGKLIETNWKDKWSPRYTNYRLTDIGIEFTIASYVGEGEYNDFEYIIIKEDVLNDKESIAEYVRKFSSRRAEARDRLERIDNIRNAREKEERERQQFLKLKEKFEG